MLGVVCRGQRRAR